MAIQPKSKLGDIESQSQASHSDTSFEKSEIDYDDEYYTSNNPAVLGLDLPPLPCTAALRIPKQKLGSPSPSNASWNPTSKLSPIWGTKIGNVSASPIMKERTRNLDPESGLDVAKRLKTPRAPTGLDRAKGYLTKNVDPGASYIPLVCFFFVTGFINVITFSAVFIWCGFQTGNTLQLALALGRSIAYPLTSPATPLGGSQVGFQIADKQALTSLLTFLFGCLLARIGDKVGSRKRWWLCAGTIAQSVFVGVAAGVLKGQPSIAAGRTIILEDPSSAGGLANMGEAVIVNMVWANAVGYIALGFASASLGMQGVMAKRVNTEFGTTVVITTVWCDLISHPKIFKFFTFGTRALASRRWLPFPCSVAAVRSEGRDARLVAVFVLFLGGFMGRVLLAYWGASATFAIAAVLRVGIAMQWLCVPSE